MLDLVLQQDQQDQPDQQDQQDQQYQQDRTGLVLKRLLQHQQDQTMIQVPDQMCQKDNMCQMKVQDQQDAWRVRNYDPVPSVCQLDRSTTLMLKYLSLTQ